VPGSHRRKPQELRDMNFRVPADHGAFRHLFAAALQLADPVAGPVAHSHGQYLLGNDPAMDDQPVCVFLMRQAMYAVPGELLDAARIDGGTVGAC
jgi:hypothetical protein